MTKMESRLIIFIILFQLMDPLTIRYMIMPLGNGIKRNTLIYAVIR